MTMRVVSVLGGTGFVGRRIVRHLRKRDFSVRVASRHPQLCQELFGTDDPHIHSVRADVRDEQSTADTIAGAQAVVNVVSLYVEHGNETFHSVHVEAARRVAAQAQRAGIEQLVHISGIGSDPRSGSLYIRKRGEGELAVRVEFPNAIIIRPAVLFGLDDGFLTTILELLQRLPIYPMFGSGLTRLQPAYVEDVAEAIVRALQRTEIEPITFECGGPRVYTYEELLRTIAREAGLTPILIPVPFVAWQALAWVAEMLPSAPITRNQVELMQVDNVSSSKIPGFRDLGITPHAVEETLREILCRH
jgi:NADH dehydrogenase